MGRYIVDVTNCSAYIYIRSLTHMNQTLHSVRAFILWLIVVSIGFLAIAILSRYMSTQELISYTWDIADSLIQVAILIVLIRVLNK